LNVQEERRKLTAAFLSNLGLAIVVAGFVVPVASVSLRLPTSPGLDLLTIAISAVWLSTGLGIHWLARRFLRQDRP
jgi:hypothetical protein